MFKFSDFFILKGYKKVASGVFLICCSQCPWIGLECVTHDIYCCRHPFNYGDECHLSPKTLASFPDWCPIIKPGNILI